MGRVDHEGESLPAQHVLHLRRIHAAGAYLHIGMVAQQHFAVFRRHAYGHMQAAATQQLHQPATLAGSGEYTNIRHRDILSA